MNWRYEEQSSETFRHINGEEYRLVRYPQPPHSRDEWIHFIHAVFGGRVADIERENDPIWIRPSASRRFATEAPGGCVASGVAAGGGDRHRVRRGSIPCHN
jgi:hypothetical protein